MSWVISLQHTLSEKTQRRTLIRNAWKRLLELIRSCGQRVHRENGRAVKYLVLRAGRLRWFLCCTATRSALAIRNYFIDQASLQVDRRARRVNTDRIDLSRLLRS